MALLTEPNRITDVLLWEAETSRFAFDRDAITLILGTPASVVGQVLGQILIGAATSAAKGGGNTGTGTLVVDVTTPVLANAKVGAYTVTVVAVGTFIVVDPKGVQIGEGVYPATGSVTFADQIKFAFTDTSTHYVVGDGFVVTVAAGSGKFTQVAPAAFDGSQNAAAVLLAPANAAALLTSGNLTADYATVALTRGPVLLKLNGLAWTSGMSGPQQTAAIAQLNLLGMVTRTDYGV